MTEPYEDDMTLLLGTISEKLVENMAPDDSERAELLAEMIEKLCTGEDYATVALALTVALKETFEEWAQHPDDDPDDPPPADDEPEEEETKTDLKLVG